jgi:hypothetical protein
VTHGGPEAQSAIGHGHDGGAQPAAFEIAQHRGPAVRALPITVFDRHQFFRPVGPHANHHDVQRRSSSRRPGKWTPSTQTYTKSLSAKLRVRHA